jgi:IS5 family transposase
MLRLHLLQHWFNLSDPGAEEALYESVSMHRFVGIDLGREPVPDETTILNFRHLMERHGQGEVLFRSGERIPASRGLRVAASSMPLSLPHQVRPRTGARRAIRRCTRRARASSGISG